MLSEWFSRRCEMKRLDTMRRSHPLFFKETIMNAIKSFFCWQRIGFLVVTCVAAAFLGLYSFGWITLH